MRLPTQLFTPPVRLWRGFGRASLLPTAKRYFETLDDRDTSNTFRELRKLAKKTREYQQATKPSPLLATSDSLRPTGRARLKGR